MPASELVLLTVGILAIIGVALLVALAHRHNRPYPPGAGGKEENDWEKSAHGRGH